MLGFWESYFIFVVATSVTSWYFFFWRLVQFAKKKGIKSALTENALVSSLVYIGLGLIIAPVTFIILIVPSFSENYMRGIYSVICDEK
jgi:hypothetical protein